MLVADWIEMDSLFFGDPDEGVGIAEYVGHFIEEQLYDDQDFCTEFFQSVFSVLNVRRTLGGPQYPLAFTNQEVHRDRSWEEVPALTFCLALSVLGRYSGYADWVAGDYVEQGDLFERLTANAMAAWLPEWDVTRTGWGGGEGTPLADLLDGIADMTEETIRAEAASFIGDDEKDIGVDVAAVRHFSDGRASLPVIFAQCASGRDWKSKLPSPDTSRWKQLVTLTHSPLKAFSMPFHLDDSAYAVRRSQFKGLLMDRQRLLPPSVESEWLDDHTAGALIAWLTARRDWLQSNYWLSPTT
jgi:hypothetical protein